MSWKGLALTLALMCALCSPTFALTKKERALVTVIQTEVREGIKDLSESHAALAQAAQRADEAEKHAADTDAAIGVVKKQIDVEHATVIAFAKLNAKMKPVYDQVTKWCGFGAIIYGIGRIVHCLIWMVVGIVVLFLIIIGLSIASPAFGIAISGIMTMLRIPVAAFHNLLVRIETWLQSRKVAPVPVPVPGPVPVPSPVPIPAPIASSTS
jgi:hypothetical protein